MGQARPGHGFAPGKVILLGEHAVVYGTPAMAGALGEGVNVWARPGHPQLRVPAWNLVVRAGDPAPLGQAYAAILERLGPCFDGASAIDLEARFDLPTGAGLGSSAALAVAVIRALATALDEEVAPAALLDAAMAAETVFHGRPSGIDHAVAAAETSFGFGRFTRAGGLTPLRAASPVTLLIGNTGRPRDTKGRVSRVAELTTERPEETRARIAAIGVLVERAVVAVADGNLGELGQAMDENQRHLEALEVSSPEIERMCSLARDAGAIGAKLTGGGGGGCVVALAPGQDREAAVRAAWTRAGFDSFVTTIGGRREERST